jgi:hypothetical protein
MNLKHGRQIALPTVFWIITCGSLLAQERLIIELGRLSFSGRYSKQVVSVKNGTANGIQDIRIECGFFNGVQLIAASQSYLENLAPGSTGFAEVLANTDMAADRAQCRIVSVR